MTTTTRRDNRQLLIRKANLRLQLRGSWKFNDIKWGDLALDGEEQSDRTKTTVVIKETGSCDGSLW